MKKYTLFLFLLVAQFVFTQELNADVVINFDQVQTSNNSAFKTLQKSLKDFVNNTKWTDKTYKTNERIECSFNIIVSQVTSNKYKASVVVQARRPVYNTTYFTPILNINDQKFSFEYTEFEQLVFNERRFSNKNLTDVISYYVYIILGYDADTFASSGGTSYFKTAEKIANNAQGQNYDGWAILEGPKTRGALVSRVLNPDYTNLRTIWYTYHREGMDRMYESETNAKSSIGNTLLVLEAFRDNYTLMYPLDIFINAKKDEIQKIFSGGESAVNTNVLKVKEVLNQISPTNAELWAKMKN